MLLLLALKPWQLQGTFWPSRPPVFYRLPPLFVTSAHGRILPGFFSCLLSVALLLLRLQCCSPQLFGLPVLPRPPSLLWGGVSCKTPGQPGWITAISTCSSRGSYASVGIAPPHTGKPKHSYTLNKALKQQQQQQACSCTGQAGFCVHQSQAFCRACEELLFLCLG